MKLKTEKQFRDKITGELHEVGSTFEVEEERGEELLADARNLVARVKESTKKAASKKGKKSDK